MAKSPSNVTSFATSGSRTIRVDKGSVILEPGELLVYMVTAAGAEAAFGFACAHRAILSAEDCEGHPTDEYQWEFTPDAKRDVLKLVLTFAAILVYTVRIDRISAGGALVETIRDVDYEAEDSTDTAEDTLSVFRRED